MEGGRFRAIVHFEINEAPKINRSDSSTTGSDTQFVRASDFECTDRFGELVFVELQRRLGYGHGN